MVTMIYIGFLAIGLAMTIHRWRWGWFLMILVAILQDPIRKMTPGTPVIFVMSTVAVYVAMLFGAHYELADARWKLSRFYPSLYQAIPVLFFILLLAAANGLVSFGLNNWKAPALSLFIYLLPLPAVLLGFLYLEGEEDFWRLLRFFVVATSIALIGVQLELRGVVHPSIGTDIFRADWVRYIPGVQIELLSGFYRSPDIMAWHAAMVAICGLILATRRGQARSWIWLMSSGWGFYICLLGGRRKMTYMVVIFAAYFLLRHFRRFKLTQFVGVVIAVMILFLTVSKVHDTAEISEYAIGARTGRAEVVHRLEGGLLVTFQQVGFMGIGLGAATQGARYMLESGRLSWQEGGAGKLAVELGLPGLLFALFLSVLLVQQALKINRLAADNPALRLLTSAITGLLLANVASFLVSHQAFTDGMLVLTNALLLGCLLKIPVLLMHADAPPAISIDPIHTRPRSHAVELG